jgi:hypothetical protein
MTSVGGYLDNGSIGAAWVFAANCGLACATPTPLPEPIVPPKLTATTTTTTPAHDDGNGRHRHYRGLHVHTLNRDTTEDRLRYARSRGTQHRTRDGDVHPKQSRLERPLAHLRNLHNTARKTRHDPAGRAETAKQLQRRGHATPRPRQRDRDADGRPHHARSLRVPEHGQQPRRGRVLQNERRAQRHVGDRPKTARTEIATI